MAYVKNTGYQNMPFSSETPQDEFCTYLSVLELAEKCVSNKYDVFNCRTVGILHSAQGRFYITDLDSPSVQPDVPVIRVTMVYLKTPLQSLVIPYAVQIFGSLQWRNRPVIFAKILQVLSIPAALRVRDTYSTVTRAHLAIKSAQEEEADPQDPT